ncbi:hypothetical protein PRO82_001951 [Candidatus Protochlamydia amoebophila]|nr:hypothetical protein [Candidatus Protochlamydia amoebophila]
MGKKFNKSYHFFTLFLPQIQSISNDKLKFELKCD